MNYVIIVAGGKGLRMGGDIPKQFMEIGGKPILMRTIQRFIDYDRNLNIIVVLPKEQQDFWYELCGKHGFVEKIQIADGGETRFHSVKNGLKLIPENENGVVGIHDGVRPHVSIEVIKKCYDEALSHKAVVPVVSIVETIWANECQDNQNSPTTVDRNNYFLGQTPQTFDIKLLKEVFEQPYDTAFTDDASVVRKAGHSITLVEGNRENIKITTPFDLRIAEALL